MTQQLSNALADLAERIREAQEESKQAETTAAARAIDAGGLLHQAKDQCRHGEWLPFLTRAGMPERQAQRLMQLARSGLKSDTVSEMGGVKAALSYLARIRLPAAGEVLLVSQHGWHELPDSKDAVSISPNGRDGRPPLAVIWPSSGDSSFYEVTVIDFGRVDLLNHPLDKSFLQSTDKPVRGESIRLEDGSFVSGLWETVDRMLNVPHAERDFRVVHDNPLRPEFAH